LLLLFIAFLELNILAVLININPNVVGIETNQNIIVSTLKTNNRPPEILASDTDQEKVLLAVATATTGTDSFYGNYLLPSIPRFLVISIQQPRSHVMLIDNTLIITEIDPIELQKISPVI